MSDAAGESDLSHIGRLKEEEERALSETREKLQQWEKFESDYSSLQKRLSTLPDKVSHQIMVPFGKNAFMPGQLVHTNEILVLLGDNWFAERSAKQACQIIDRRKKYVKSMMDDLKQQQYLLESRLGFVSDIQETAEGKGDVVEIREEYDPQKEAKWKEERRARFREAAETKEKEKEEESKKPAPTEDELLWARLDELERMEEEMDEMELADEDDTNTTMPVNEEQNSMSQHSLPESSSQKHVHWQDDNSKHQNLHLNLKQNDDDDEEEEEDEEDAEESVISSESTSVIHFSHTSNLSKVLPKTEDTPDLSPRSPGEIYDLYQASHTEGQSIHTHHDQPKSILKNAPSPQINPNTHRPLQKEKAVPLPASASAFTGSIVEHKESDDSIQTDQSQAPKRVSKFKAARQGKR